MIPVFMYCVIAAGFAVPTILEGNAEQLGWGFYRFAGLLACAVWPLFILVVIAASLCARPAGRPDSHVGKGSSTSNR